MTKTPWSRDEYILLLDLYLRLRERHSQMQKIPEVEALSRELWRMNPAAVKAYAKHRNPAGVSIYLCKMMAHDPAAIGRGLSEKKSASGYLLREAVFTEFSANEAALAAEVARIRSGYNLDQTGAAQQVAAQNHLDKPGQIAKAPPAVREPASELYGGVRSGWRKWLYEWLIKLARKL